jgi:hypothetical protein
VGSSGVYLNDHLAGATAGIRLAKRCRDRFPSGQARQILDGIVSELEEDRVTLEHVMAAAGARPDQLKQVGAVTVEIASRLMHALPLLGTRSSVITRLEEVELLSLGIEGKRLLWAALRRAAERDVRLRGFDFSELEERARSQRDSVEHVRLALASDGLRGLPAEGG